MSDRDPYDLDTMPSDPPSRVTTRVGDGVTLRIGNVNVRTAKRRNGGGFNLIIEAPEGTEVERL